VLFGFANDGAAQVPVHSGRVESDSHPQFWADRSRISSASSTLANPQAAICQHALTNNGTTASARMSLAFLMTTSTRETRLWGRRNQLLGYPRRTSSPAKGCMFCATICTRNWPLFG